MREYRVFFIERNNRISSVPEIIECADDQDAIQKAMPLVDGHDVEIWHGDRLVSRLPRTG